MNQVLTQGAAVEYRLLPGGPFPAALQDGLSVYAHLVHVDKINPEHIVLLGDSAGGNIVLAMARWLRDTKVLPQAGGLLLFSVSSFSQICLGTPLTNAGTALVRSV